MRTTRAALALLLAASLVATPAVTVAAADGFVLQPSTELSTPERTVSIGGEDYRISSIGRADADGAVTLSVDAPESAGVYTVNVYNADKQIVASERVTGDGTYTLASSLSAGTYLAGVVYDGTLRTVVPVVVASYTASASAPTSVTRGERLSIDATLGGESATPNRVDVVLFNGSYNRTVTATRVGDGEYNVLVDTDGLAPGEYSYYVGVRGTERVAGQLELLGVSDRHTVTVEANTSSTTTTTTTTTSTTQSGGGGGGGGGAVATTTTTTSTTTTTTTATTTTATTSTTTTDATGSAENETVTSRSAGETTTTTSTTDGVLTPSDPTSTETTAGSSPGVSPLAAGIALALAALLARRP